MYCPDCGDFLGTTGKRISMPDYDAWKYHCKECSQVYETRTYGGGEAYIWVEEED